MVYKSASKSIIYFTTTTLAIRLPSRPTNETTSMQLLSFSICFAIALHVVVAASFPAGNEPVPWQIGERITGKAEIV